MRGPGDIAANERGNVAIVFAACLPLIVAGAALAMETGYWYLKDRDLQSAADAGAYAATLARQAGADEEAVMAVALSEAQKNGFEPADGTIAVRTPTSGGEAGNARALEVVLTQREPRFFTGLFSSTPVGLTARAVARSDSSGSACILALDGSASRAADFGGNSSLTLNGCVVMANSTADDAVRVGGSSSVEAPCLIAAGGVEADDGAVLECSSPMTGATPIRDPYEDVEEPEAKNCKPISFAKKGKTVLTPGCYSGGAKIQGEVEFSPGVYVFSGGSVQMNAKADVKGEGVTLFFADDADLDINGQAKVDLSAPTSGATKGIVLFGARDNDQLVKMNGGAGSKLTGAVYFPNQALDYRGGFDGINGCTQYVAKTLSWLGNTSLSVDCEDQGLTAIPAAQTVKLAE